MQTLLSALPAILVSLFRHALTAAGLSGVLTDDTSTELAGAIAVLLGLAWSIWSGVRLKRAESVLADPPADKTGPHGTQILGLIVFWFCLGLLGFFFTGCANQRSTKRIVSVKHTVLGLDVAQSMNSMMPAFRLGLVRSFWQEIPVETNQIFAPEYVASTVADVQLTQQKVNEDSATGSRGVDALRAVLAPPPSTNAPPSTNSPTATAPNSKLPTSNPQLPAPHAPPPAPPARPT